MPYITKGVYENGQWIQKQVYVSDTEYKAVMYPSTSPTPVVSTPPPIPEVISQDDSAEYISNALRQGVPIVSGQTTVSQLSAVPKTVEAPTPVIERKITDVDRFVEEQKQYREATSTIATQQANIDVAKKEYQKYLMENEKYDTKSLYDYGVAIDQAQKNLNRYKGEVDVFGSQLESDVNKYISGGGLTDVGVARSLEPKYVAVREQAQFQQGIDLARNAVLQNKPEITVSSEKQAQGAGYYLESGQADIDYLKQQEILTEKQIEVDKKLQELTYGGLTQFGEVRQATPEMQAVKTGAEIQRGIDKATNAVLQGKESVDVKNINELYGANVVFGAGGLTDFGKEFMATPEKQAVAVMAERQRGIDKATNALLQGKEVVVSGENELYGANLFLASQPAQKIQEQKANELFDLTYGGLTLAGMIKTSTPEYQKIIESSDVARSKDLERWAKKTVNEALISGKEDIPVKTQAQFLAVENLLKTDYVNEVFEELILSTPKGEVTSSPITQTDLGLTITEEPISFTELGGDLITKHLYGGTGLAGVGKDVAEVGLAGLGFFEGIGRSLAYGVGSILPFTDLNPRVSEKMASDLIMKGSVRLPSGLGAGISITGKQFLGTSEVSLPIGLGFDLGLGSQYDVEFAKKHPSFAVSSALLDVFALKGMANIGFKSVYGTEKILGEGLGYALKAGGKGVTKLVDEFKVKPVKPFKPLDIDFKLPLSEQTRIRAGKPYPKLTKAETKALIDLRKDIIFRAPLSEQLKIKSGKAYPKLSSAETKALIDLRKDIIFREPISEQLKIRAGKPSPKLSVAETKTLINLRKDIVFKSPLSEQMKIRAGKPFPKLSEQELKGLIDVYKPIQFKPMRTRGMLPKDKPLTVSEMNKVTEFLPIKKQVKTPISVTPTLTIEELNLLAKRLPSWREKVSPVYKTKPEGVTVKSGKSLLVTEQKPLLKTDLELKTLLPQKLKTKTVKAPTLFITPELIGVLTNIQPLPQKLKVRRGTTQKQLTLQKPKLDYKQISLTTPIYKPVTTQKIKQVTKPVYSFKSLTLQTQKLKVKPKLDYKQISLTTPIYKQLTTPKLKVKQLTLQKQNLGYKQITLQTQKLTYKPITQTRTRQVTTPKQLINLQYKPLTTPKIRQVTTPDSFQGFDIRIPDPTKTKTPNIPRIPKFSDEKRRRTPISFNRFGRKKFVNPLATFSEVLGTKHATKKKSNKNRGEKKHGFF